MHLAFIAPPFTSHVRAMESLARILLDRGHQVSWIHQIDVKPLIQDRRIAFHAVGRDIRPAGSLDPIVTRAAHPGGPLGLKRVIADVASTTDMLCREAPALLDRLGVDGVVADQMEAAGGLVAEGIGVPFISVACALPVNRDPHVPLPVMPWGYARDPKGLQLNEGSTRVYDWLMRRHGDVIRNHALRFGLGERQAMHECLSPLAQISQTTAGFDFPRQDVPTTFHHVGPLRGARTEEPPLDLPLDATRPFVFASLGTLQGWRMGLFERIADACCLENFQLLIAHCDRLDNRQEAALRRRGATAVTGFAPQRSALARADLVVTHAGLNTVLDAMEAGTPQLALPIAFDQPGVAARVVQAGSGLSVLPLLARQTTLRRSMRRLIEEPQFAACSRALGEEIAASGGAAWAADIVETAIATRRPVTRRQAATAPVQDGAPRE